MTMTAITTSNSINVNAFWLPKDRTDRWQCMPSFLSLFMAGTQVIYPGFQPHFLATTQLILHQHLRQPILPLVGVNLGIDILRVKISNAAVTEQHI
jgi:hypothetical protein